MSWRRLVRWWRTQIAPSSHVHPYLERIQVSPVHSVIACRVCGQILAVVDEVKGGGI